MRSNRPTDLDALKRLSSTARYLAEDVAAVLRIPIPAVAVLVKGGLLVTLSSTKHNCVKWFCRVTIEKLACDEQFLRKMTRYLEVHYRERNSQYASHKRNRLDIINDQDFEPPRIK